MVSRFFNSQIPCHITGTKHALNGVSHAYQYIESKVLNISAVRVSSPGNADCEFSQSVKSKRVYP